jgi:hypothetical protein
MGGERFVSGRGECVREAIGALSMLRLIRSTVPLTMSVANFRFELGVESNYFFILFFPGEASKSRITCPLTTTHTQTHTNTHTVHTHTHKHTHTHTHTYIHIYMYIFTCTSLFLRHLLKPF